ncbi:MAG: Poly A polymerase head domain [Bacteriophage sp.]|nr:MAG: Poly A polymerase head domain [Bacteriophage sp.]
MRDFKFYEVGGKIRDELLGLTNKDVDYVAVPTNELLYKDYTAEEMFKLLYADLAMEKFEIFLVTPECYTIRAKFPEGYKYQGVADFVMARKEVGYVPGTRTPIVEPGNLYDDLSRRDFTVNAMAKDPDTGEIIDYFNGKTHLARRLLVTPLDPITTFDDDPLRILRGIRFSITKRLLVSQDMWQVMKSYDYFNKMPVVSEERIREELTKCFKCNSSLALGWLSELTELRDYIFTKTSLWLKPTNEK